MQVKLRPHTGWDLLNMYPERKTSDSQSDIVDDQIPLEERSPTTDPNPAVTKDLQTACQTPQEVVRRRSDFSNLTPNNYLMVGTLVAGKYKILSHLAPRGMPAVYKAL